MAGERQEADNKSHKAEYGASPNGVANRWLARHKGEIIGIKFPGEGPGATMSGKLIAFDAYSLLVRVMDPNHDVEDRLIFKGPGVVVVGDVDDAD